jgi:hypothetical protein
MTKNIPFPPFFAPCPSQHGVQHRLIPQSFIIETQPLSVIIACARSFNFFLIFGSPRWRPIHFHALVLAIFASLIAPFGGFFASEICFSAALVLFDVCALHFFFCFRVSMFFVCRWL